MLTEKEIRELPPEQANDMCWIHRVLEPFEEGDYRYCYECGHVYKTEQELLDEFNKECKEVCNSCDHKHVDKTSGVDIFFCPLCLHDF